MINILLKDKNGVEVSNGDILKIVSIKKEFQEEFDPYFNFNVGVNIDWEEITINPQQDLDNLGYCGIDNYEYFTKETLLEIFDLPPNCTDEEYKEYVYDEICKNLKINPKDEDDFFKIINGFEIIYPQVSEIKIKFYGIDNFNRPVFKKIDERKFYGDTENLFSHHETKDDVMKKINPENLVYFGNAFNCEPCGLKLKKEYKFKIIDE